MADYVIKLTLATARDPDPSNSAAPRASVVNFGRLLERVATGSFPGSNAVVVDSGSSGATAATGTVTFASIAAADTVTVGNQVFTARVSPSGANEFALGANDTAAAAALVAKVNAHTSLTGVCTATSAAAVVTVTADTPGTMGNGLSLASSNNTRAAVVAMSGGASTRVTYTY